MPQTSTAVSEIPSYIQQPTQDALTSIQNWLRSPQNRVYGTRPGESLWTPLTSSQRSAMGNVGWLANQNLGDLLGGNRANALLERFANFQPGRLVDEGGYLGEIDDYMDPYLEEVLNPQIREINDQLQIGRRDLGANATMSGAFGDARHGVVEGQLYEGASENAADVTGRAHSDAWREAMGLRSADREAAVQQNQNLATAASGIAGLGQNYLSNFLDVNDALFNAGSVERDANQERSDAMRRFQEALNSRDYDSALRMLGAIRGTQYPTTSTTETESDDGLTGILGSLLGGLFS